MIAETATGKVEGFVRDNCNVFLGIPYAAPPLGENRFGPPVAHAPWARVRECFAFGPTAPQRNPGFTIIPEPVEHGDDFLNLNIFTPSLDAKLPVFVYIHGGGFVSGCNRSPWYDGARFARDGVVVVNIGYRLGVEGFLDVEGAVPNRAVLDWVFALEWVRENIANFGGDPSNVTIGGQSAGSAACLTLMVNPRAEGLVRRVIAMSGTSDTRMPREVLTDASAKLAAHLGAEPTREALAAFSPQQLVDAWDDAFGNPFTADAIARGFDPRAPALKPFVDGEVIPAHPFRCIGANATPLLIGSTTKEINAGAQARRKDLEGFAREVVAGFVSDVDAYASVVGSDDPVDLLAQAISDRGFRVPLVRLLDDRAANGTPTWAYQFGWGSATHCTDIPFAFDNLDAEGVTDPGRVGPGAPQPLADAMHRTFTSFCIDGTIGWPSYGTEARPVMMFDVESGVADDALGFARSLF